MRRAFLFLGNALRSQTFRGAVVSAAELLAWMLKPSWRSNSRT